MIFILFKELFTYKFVNILISQLVVIELMTIEFVTSELVKNVTNEEMDSSDKEQRELFLSYRQ